MVHKSILQRQFRQVSKKKISFLLQAIETTKEGSRHQSSQKSTQIIVQSVS